MKKQVTNYYVCTECGLPCEVYRTTETSYGGPKGELRRNVYKSLCCKAVWVVKEET